MFDEIGLDFVFPKVFLENFFAYFTVAVPGVSCSPSFSWTVWCSYWVPLWTRWILWT